MDRRLQEVLTDFGLSAPEPFAETAIAALWTARNRTGERCVVKLYHAGTFGNEATGVSLMRAWADSGACVHVLATLDDALLMPFLEGPQLGARSRAGDDVTACADLGRLAARLHRAPLPALSGLPGLDTWFQALFALRFAPACKAPLKRAMGRAAGLARDLLAEAAEPRPLHGDLHHDNVIETAQGPIAIDAKGVWGDPAFELANALRNPKGCGERLRDADHMRARLQVMAEQSGTCPARLARWGAAKSALSIAWRSGGLLEQDAEGDLLALLITIAETPSP
ncbi:aminoglycoside phosphotransferase family protein [Antarctobacter jejuensis]|uniref:aminoglycoside phosphotransferase family protein n=1 Tax=Antarctobacter jejuensis TaxID=1439938 RepID=UPI003FD3BA95